ncbi:hypothetical protein CKAN_02246900 [Cinnamomum micranthum f. kanehirae]|uniref:Uncharacterized protein n=1 Tax=Cinnamomum micranthum f. kanehirae TaxID=337451 RepID=A0A443PR22_9MAGN|nr:hypothetical protein CKAN_02246900 [Cinnamomum micranthum f. kanehirae]
MRNQSPYILKVFGKCNYDVDRHGNKREILFAEAVEDTLETWANKNLLLEPNYPERLSLRFIGILLDILHGIIHFHLKLKRPHGEICSGNIYIVDGKAKLAHVVDRFDQNSFVDDINKFCFMVRHLFAKDGLATPLELDQLCNSLRLYKADGYLRNSVNHPVLLTPKERGEVRHLAHSLICESPNEVKIGKSLVRELQNASRKFHGAIQGPHWIGNVSEQEFLGTLNFQNPPYRDIPLDFIRYCRNVGEHVRGDARKPWITDEYRDEMLTSFLPGFLPILHDVLSFEGICVRTLPNIT